MLQIRSGMLQTGSSALQPRYNLTTSKTGCTPFVHRRCYNVTTYESFFYILKNLFREHKKERPLSRTPFLLL